MGVFALSITTTNMMRKYTLALTLFAGCNALNLISNKEASNFLSRQRRANGGVEEALPSSKHRECSKEQCDFEEYVEAKENETKNQGIKLREFASAKKGSKYDSDIADTFARYYTDCYQKIAADPGLSDKKAVDLRPNCVKVFDEYLDNKLSNYQPTQTNNNNDQTNYQYNYDNADKTDDGYYY